MAPSRRSTSRGSSSRRPPAQRTDLRNPTSAAGQRDYLSWAIATFLLLIVAAIFGQTLAFGFLHYDDHLFILDSPQMRAGLNGENIVWAFTHGPTDEWYPLSILSHMLDCQFFGLSAWGHHLTNVLLHAAASIGLFLVWRSMTGELWPSAFVATLFAVHPQHVESVAWIAERRDVLSGLLFVLTLAAYLGYLRHGRSFGRYALLAAVYSLGLMSKSMLVTVPPLLLLLDFWPLGRFGGAADLPASAADMSRPGFWWLVVEKMPLLAPAAIDCALTLATHVNGRGALTLSWPDRLSNAVVALDTYLLQFFYPSNLTVFYPFPAGGFPVWHIAAAATILLAISLAAVVVARRLPYLPVGWFWFLGMMVPVLGLVAVSNHSMADRYMYLPGIGLYVALAWGATRLASHWQAGRLWLGAAATGVIALLTGLAAWQASYWRDDLTLWTHALAVTEDNAEAETNLAFALADLNRLDEAVEHYQRATKFQVDPPLLNNLGTTLGRQGKFDAAEAQFRQALKLDPEYAPTYNNLGFAIYLQGRSDEAAEQFRRAIQLDPSLWMPHFRLANLLLKADQIDDAIFHFEQAIALAPENAAPREGLAAARAARAPAK